MHAKTHGLRTALGYRVLAKFDFTLLALFAVEAEAALLAGVVVVGSVGHGGRTRPRIRLALVGELRPLADVVYREHDAGPRGRRCLVHLDPCQVELRRAFTRQVEGLLTEGLFGRVVDAQHYVQVGALQELRSHVELPR